MPNFNFTFEDGQLVYRDAEGNTLTIGESGGGSGGTEFFEVKVTSNIMGVLEADKTWSEISAATKPILLSYNGHYYIPQRYSLLSGGYLYVISAVSNLGNPQDNAFEVMSITWQSTGYSVTVASKTTDVGTIMIAIAPFYSDVQTYAVGSLVMSREGSLYQCITAVDSPEEFDINKWSLTSLANIIASR